MILAPLSEFYGRRPIYLMSFSCFSLLMAPCALAPNIGVLLAFRFLSGVAGSASLSVSSGTVSDLFAGSDLGAPMMICTASSARTSLTPRTLLPNLLPVGSQHHRITANGRRLQFVGLTLGPLIGGFINQNAKWQWTFWVMLAWAVVELAALWLSVPETYEPVLLRLRAERRRAERLATGDTAALERPEAAPRSIPRTVARACQRPFQLLVLDPMVLLLCVSTSIVMGLLYLSFQALPLVFGRMHGFDQQTSGLTFLGLLVGVMAGALSDPLWRRLHGHLAARQAAPHAEAETEPYCEPELRLPPGVVGGVLVPVGLFVFAWSAQPHVHWLVPIAGLVLSGAGMLLVFSAVLTFLVEAYPLWAASALAANSFMLNSFAAGFPLFWDALYHALGDQMAGYVLVCLALPIAPLLAAFVIWGKRLRARSRFAGGSHPHAHIGG